MLTAENIIDHTLNHTLMNFTTISSNINHFLNCCMLDFTYMETRIFE